MKLYIDGDALPNMLKDVLVRAIDRVGIQTIVVANKRVSIGQSRNVDYVRVADGPDQADNYIVEQVQAGDLVITTDIPLADRIVSKGAIGMDHRGEQFNENNIKEILSMRDYMQELRDMGVPTQGPAPFNKKDVHGFINQLDRFFTEKGLK